MNKIKWFFIALFGCEMFLSAQTRSNVEAAFLSMPEEYYLAMPVDSRVALLNAYDSDSSAFVTNKFNGRSSILNLEKEKDWMKIRNSENGLLELKLLRQKDTVAYAVVILTACAPICTSHAGFFDYNWRLLRYSLMPEVSVSDFYDKEKMQKEGYSLDNLQSQIDIPFIQFSFVDGVTLEVALHVDKYLDEQTYMQIKPFLKGNRMSYLWDGTSFQLQKIYFE